MVIRTRLRSVLIPLALYCVSGVSAFYFVWHAVNGERGLKAKAEYKRQISALELEMTAVRGERKQWEQRVALMRAEAIDRDLLEEQARGLLDKVDKRDLVIFIEQKK